MHTIKIMVMKNKKYFKMAALLPVIFAMACSAGPTKRYVDGQWNVSENICSSNPDQSDLGDMRSEVRGKESYEMSFDRKITIFYLDRTILDVSQKFNRSGSSGEMMLYENSSTNPIVGTIKILNTRELNNTIESGIEKYFANDPNIDGNDANSFCLYRGQ